MRSKTVELEGNLYEVFESGEIHSLDRIITHWRGGVSKIKGKKLIPIIRKGYATYNISNKGKAKIYNAHRIVASAFIHNPENKPQINHKNGNKVDNRFCNLEWATISENTQHAFDTGLIKKRYGKDNPQSKLSEDDKKQVRELIAKGAVQRQIAAIFNVSPATITRHKQLP